jgi:hypothetical protein
VEAGGGPVEALMRRRVNKFGAFCRNSSKFDGFSPV